MAALISLTLSLAWACGGGSEQAALPDSVVVDTALMVDTVRAAPPAASAADSTTVEPAAVDLAGALDSLRAQLARIESRVESLPSASPSLLGAEPEVQPTQDQGLDAGRRVQETAQDVRHFTLRAIWAAILLIAALFFIRAAVWLLGVLSERSAERRLLFKRLIPMVRLLVWALVIFYVVSSVFEVDRAGLLAGTAGLGVGLGFAAQGVLKNVLGGLIIVFDQPFQVGDKIRVGGTYGEVVSIGMRATRIVTPDDNLVSVPNSQVVEDQVANANAGALDCQVVVDLYLPGWVDVAKAKAIALSVAMNSQYTYLDKPVVVNVKDEFDRIFLTHLLVKAYVIDTRYEFALASDITEAAKTEFLREGLLPPLMADLDAPFDQLLARKWSGEGVANE
jgi:small-conductance mechanosensitive channel